MSLFKKNKQKVFCIGLNKTGTTSLGSFLEQQGFLVERQVHGERLLKKYLDRDFKTIVDVCSKSKSSVFQDVPYSLPYTFMHLDNALPNAKFILTVRDSPEQWYESILNFHSRIFNNGLKPDIESLKQSKYIYTGWAWDLMNDVFINNNSELYNKNFFIKVYNNHNENIKNYFKNKNNLITVNLSNDLDAEKVCKFLGMKFLAKKFPLISSNDIAIRNYNVRFLGKKQE